MEALGKGLYGDDDEDDLGGVAEEGGGFDEVLQADVVGAEGLRVVGGEARTDDADGSGRLAVHGGIDENDPLEVLEEGKEVEAPRPAVEKGDVRRPGFLLQPPHRVNAHPLVAEKDVSHAQNQDRPGFLLRPVPDHGFSAGLSTNFHPPAMEEMTPRPST